MHIIHSRKAAIEFDGSEKLLCSDRQHSTFSTKFVVPVNGFVLNPKANAMMIDLCEFSWKCFND